MDINVKGNRHPEWWSRIESLILLGSPIGGAHLAKIVDPLDLMHSAIAQDLGVDRRTLAEAIAQVVPTLIIAGDRKRGSDGTVLVQTTQFQHAKFVCIPGVKHSGLKSNDAVDHNIRSFWAEKMKIIVLSEETSLTETIWFSQISRGRRYIWIIATSIIDNEQEQTAHIHEHPELIAERSA